MDTKFAVRAVVIDKAIELFENTTPVNEYEKNIHNRDMKFLEKARDFIESSDL
jgi:hypothetical protein